MLKSSLKYALWVVAAVAACGVFHIARVAHNDNLILARAEEAMAGRNGALYLAKRGSLRSRDFATGLRNERFAPCSTFKIWNTLIGLECGILRSPDDPFYQWDGSPQLLKEWERDLTLREAFQVSCVPAYRELARKIGDARMNQWLEKIGYGDRDTSLGIDAFWLPSEAQKRGIKPLTISASEQARLMVRLVAGDLPFSKESLAVLKEIMLAAETPAGKLYGKTGSSMPQADGMSIGWYVGYFEGKGGTWAFACLLYEKGASGKDARAVVEKIFGP